MGSPQTLTDQIDLVIDYFNRRRMDLPDGFFERKTQFLLNGTAFETLLSSTPNDPLILMLARGPAGYRFTAKALQHAIPDAKLERGDLVTDASTVRTQVWLSGKLRDTREALNALVTITLRLTQAGAVEIAEAVIDPGEMEKIRRARSL